MALSIKNPEAYRLAQALSRETGESLTATVTNALRERLDSLHRSSDVAVLEAEIAEIQAFVAALPDRDTRSAEEILGYDASGLPI